MKAVLLSGIFFLALAAFFLGCNKTTGDDPSGIPPCLPANLSNGIIAFYTFSNGSLSDASGNDNNLVNNTGAVSTTDRSGNPNCAYLFNGTQTLSAVNPVFLDNLSKFSISLWYEPIDSSRLPGNYEALVCRDTVGGCPDRYGQWSVGLFDCRRAVFAAQNSVWDTVTAPSFNCQDLIAARTGSWHHLTAVYDGPGGVISIYRDGVFQESAPAITTGCSTPPHPIFNTGDLFLGKYYKGRMDDVIIFNRVLSQPEITQLSQMGTCCAMPQ